MDDKKSLLTTLPPLLVAAGTLITAVIGLGNFMSSPAPSVTEFDVIPTIVDAGGNATLKWVVSGDVSSVSIDPGIGAVALSGSRQISPANTTNYTLTARNKGQAKTASAQLIVRAVKAAQGGVQESNSGSIQKPILPSAPSSANNVGDEPVHNDVPVAMNAINSANNANSASNPNTVNTTNTIETTGKDKSAISSEQKPSGSHGLASRDTGDEPVQMSNLESTSQSKEPIKHINASSNSAAGDEPIQMIKPTGTNIGGTAGTPNTVNQTGQTKAEAGTTKAQSNVGDVA